MDALFNVKFTLLVVTCMYTFYGSCTSLDSSSSSLSGPSVSNQAMCDNRPIQDNSAGCSTSSVNDDDVRRTELLWHEPIIPDGKRLVKVMSYNVLAQDLIILHPHLYRNHNPTNLIWEKRQKLLMHEFLKSDADIIALQEVQESHIAPFYKQLEHYGYKGFFKKRTDDDKTDGCALYYKVDMFDLIQMQEVEFHQPGVKNLNKPNVALIAKLKHKGNNKELIIANTHLLFSPRKADVRLAQVQVLLAELHRIASSSESPSVMLVGDLNSSPDAPIIRLLERGFYEAEKPVIPAHLGILPNCTYEENSSLYTRKMISSIFDDESCGTSEKIGSNPSSHNEQSECHSMSDVQPAGTNRDSFLVSPLRNLLSHSFNFTSTYNFYDRSFHNIATTYQDRWLTVDYMFYSNMTLLSRQRLPTIEDCKAHIGRIPSDVSPSDHLPLLAAYVL